MTKTKDTHLLIRVSRQEKKEIATEARRRRKAMTAYLLDLHRAARSGHLEEENRWLKQNLEQALQLGHDANETARNWSRAYDRVEAEKATLRRSIEEDGKDLRFAEEDPTFLSRLYQLLGISQQDLREDGYSDEWFALIKQWRHEGKIPTATEGGVWREHVFEFLAERANETEKAAARAALTGNAPEKGIAQDARRHPRKPVA